MILQLITILNSYKFIWVLPKIMVPPNHPMFNRVFHYFHHPFWDTPIFGNHHRVKVMEVDLLIETLLERHEKEPSVC